MFSKLLGVLNTVYVGRFNQFVTFYKQNITGFSVSFSNVVVLGFWLQCIKIDYTVYTWHQIMFYLCVFQIPKW